VRQRITYVKRLVQLRFAQAYRFRYTTCLGDSSGLTLAPSVGGWLLATWADGRAWVRFAKDEHDKLTQLVELHVLDPTPEKLRHIPLRRIQTAVTSKGALRVQSMLAAGLNKPVPAEMFTAFRGRPLEEPPRYRLKRPARRKRDDRFFKNVARCYTDAAIRGLPPRKAIVVDTGVADATAGAWVLEARRRGFLPPTEPGKVSS
jgi:hypothetical protein